MVVVATAWWVLLCIEAVIGALITARNLVTWKGLSDGIYIGFYEHKYFWQDQ